YRGAPAFTEHSGAFPIGDPASVTGPLPAVDDEPLERGDEYLPIFASVESAWFRRPDKSTALAESAAGHKPSQRPGTSSASGSPVSETGDSGQQQQPEDGWWSRADSGFRAAASVKDPQLGGVTAAGLPKRTPKANLVPGSVGGENG